MAKRTLENCSLIELFETRPIQHDGKCEGFQKSYEDDGTCEICKECKLNTMYEE